MWQLHRHSSWNYWLSGRAAPTGAGQSPYPRRSCTVLCLKNGVSGGHGRGRLKRTVETDLGCRVVGRVEGHADAFETVVVLCLKGGGAACRDGATLERRLLAQSWTKMTSD
jgi:hypothetical protein